MALVSKKLRDSAKGQPCTFRIMGICNRDTETTVLCHIHDGTKGMGNKALDISAAFGCSACHDAIDNHRLPKFVEVEYCLAALQRTQQIWRDMGLIVIAGDVEKPRKPSGKVVSRSSLYQPAPLLKD